MSIIFFLALESYTEKYSILSPSQMEKVFIFSYILEVKIHRTLPISGISHPTLYLYFLYHTLFMVYGNTGILQIQPVLVNFPTWLVQWSHGFMKMKVDASNNYTYSENSEGSLYFSFAR